MSDQHICQVALTALNGPALREWYADVFGLLHSGKALFFPPSTARVQGIPGAWEKCSWLIDAQDYFQLEFFQFWSPRGALKPAGWRPCDHGYNMMGIAVADFDQVLHRVRALSPGCEPAVTGEAGDRRACVTDPEGNWVEIYERDVLAALDGDAAVAPLRPEVPAVVRSMRVSVPCLADARAAYVDALGLALVEDVTLHDDRDEALWGLSGARAQRLLLRARNFLVELVEYETPEAAPRPADYSLAHQGYMNIALGYRQREQFDRCFQRAVGQGMRPNGEVLDIGVFRVMYVNDPQGYSVEMLHARKAFWSLSGFNAADPSVEIEVDIRAPAEQVWRHVTDHAGIGRWSLFSGRVLREGTADPNGEGCIRELRAPGLRIVEEVTEWQEGRHFAYRLRSGAPFSRHRGDVFVEQRGDISRVRMAIRFRSRIPFTGKLTAWLLGAVFRRALRTLQRQLG